jgi:hypothetical protein
VPGDVAIVVVIVVVVVVVVVVAAAAGTATATVEGADPAPATATVAVGPGVRTTGPGVPGVVPSFCARFVVLPRPRSFPMSPPPGVPGIPVPFPTAVSWLSVPAFAPPPVAVAGPLSSSIVGTGTGAGAGTGVAPAPLFDTDGRRTGVVK